MIKVYNSKKKCFRILGRQIRKVQTRSRNEFTVERDISPFLNDDSTTRNSR